MNNFKKYPKKDYKKILLTWQKIARNYNDIDTSRTLDVLENNKNMRKKYSYINDSLGKKEIEKFWKNKKLKIRLATEKYMFSPNMKIKEIQKRFNVHMCSFYAYSNRLLQLGLIYIVS